MASHLREQVSAVAANDCCSVNALLLFILEQAAKDQAKAEVKATMDNRALLSDMT
jgi:hypothetical protein